MTDTRHQLAKLLRFTLPTATPDHQRTERVDLDGFARTLIVYRGADGGRVPAFLFEPHEPGGGAVLAVHQHASQWQFGKSEVAGLVGDPLQAFAPALAKAGITVLAPDMPGFEERMVGAGAGAELAPTLERPGSTKQGWLQYYNLAMHRIVSGDYLLTEILGDCAAAISLLLSLPEVDASRVGVFGHSFGGNTTLFHAALDTRVAFACASGAACSYRHKLEHGTGLEMALVVPSIAERFDLDDLFRCICPRSLLVVSSEDDPYSADARVLVDDARAHYEAAERSSYLEHLRTAGGHDLDATRFAAIENWLTRTADG
ncbi:MAG: acetylxylan esterase [Myxococcales bacterium]|nr:acetylxylan esterase [Myxococcales bacterium]